MKKIYFILGLLIGLAGVAQAQTYKLSKEPAQFILDVKAMMGPTKNEGAIRVATRLEEIWGTNQMTSSQQAKVIELSHKMLAKKLKARPHFENFFGALVSGINIHKLSNASLDQLLTVTEKSLEKDKLPEFEKFLQTSYSFLEGKLIYKSALNTLRVLGGTFTFAYKDGTEPEPQEEPAPVKPAPAPKAAAKTPAKKAAPKDEEIVWNDAIKDDPPAATTAPTLNLPPGTIPPVVGAVLQLQNIDLFFISGPDSLLLKNTDGALLLTRHIFVGNKSRFDWAQANGEASATLKKFSFDTSKPAFRAENVTVSYPAVLEAPVEGVFEFRNVRKKANSDTGYPKFVSYTNNARLKNIGENIAFVGGFTMAGNKIGAGALDGSGSEITITLEGKPKFKATAANFVLQDSLITSDRAAILIFQNRDSIAHPGIRMKYSKPKKHLTLTRSEQSQVSPFYSSYHQMEINSEMLLWDLTSPNINFSILTAKNEVPARLASKEYFTEDRYEHLKGTSDFHPLMVMTNFAEKRRTNTFYLRELAENTKIREAELQVAASMLARQHFLDFNSTTGQVTLKSKAVHYMKSARGKKDYDYITLKSLMPSGKNATLNLNKNELLVRGVDKFYFTGDSVAVYALPDSNQVRILQNRDIKFNGVVVASLFRFRGSNFNFKYNEFLINMGKIDTIAFAVRKKKKKGVKDTGSEQFSSNTITKSAGTLYLNKANNKSGRKKYLDYPKFDATAGAYVFFNKPEILGGAYDTTVYFAIPPFKLDSLNSSVPGVVGFKGKFYSGGIFPPIETQLAVMDDQSLGFEYISPKGGLPAYGGKGKFYNKLTMSKKGLQGSGEVDYLSTKLKSNAFTFYLDKVLTLGTQATISEATINNVYYMGGSFNKYALEWLPLKDTMNISTVTEPFRLYQNKYTYRGMAVITPTGFYGDGTVEGTDGSIRSSKIVFAKDQFKANNATLEIKSKSAGKPALRASDVFLEFDVSKGIAAFSPERAGVASTDFPNAQFKTSLSGGKWDINKKLVTMNESGDNQNSHAYFVSERPSHENLKFRAKSASYDISKNTLRIGGVPYIAVADAHVLPDSGKVYITEGANLKTLQNARIVSDTLRQYHRMVKGEVDVVSRIKYQGYANTKYVNALSDSFTVKFGQFSMKHMENLKPVTVAKTDVKAKEPEAPVESKIGVNTEILTDDTTAVAVAPAKRRGLFRKVNLASNNKKATVPAEKAPPQEAGDAAEPDLLADAGPVRKKSRRKPPGLKTEAVSDTSALVAAAGNPEKTSKFRLFKKQAEEGPNDAPHTEAVATIKETDKFIIAPGVRYKGDITMNSNREFWNFDGFVKLTFGGEESASDWFPYKATVNPAEVKINIESSKVAGADQQKTGLYIAAATNKIYNTFVSAKKDETDLEVFEVDGQLAYNKGKQEYKLGKESRLDGEDYSSNLMTFSDSTGVSQYDGKFKLIQPYKNFGIEASGTARAKPKAKLYTLDALLAISMNLPEAALVQMGNVLADNLANAPEAIADNSAMLYKLAAFAPSKEAKAYADRSDHTPLPVFSTKFQKALVLNASHLRWSDSTHAWYSKNKLGLSNVLKKDINAQIPAYLEIKRGPDTDIVSLYLEANPGVWYYFNYDNNTLMAASSDDKFNSIIASKRSSSLLTGEEMDKTSFVLGYRKNYLENSKYDPIGPNAGRSTPASKSGNFDFMEEGGKKKKRDKAPKEEPAEAPVTKPARQEKAADPVAQPDITEEPKKKKKSKKGKDDGLLPDVDQ